MRKLAMILEEECLDIGPLKSAEKFGYSKQRYYQILDAFQKIGSDALVDKKRGPKAKRRRTSELQRQVIRYRCLDPQASPAVIAQKLRQTGFTISVRSVERVIQEYRIQKNSTGAAQETARTFLSINFIPKWEKSWSSILTACRAIASDIFGCMAKKRGTTSIKTAQTFWAFDEGTKQPLRFTTATVSQTVREATPELLNMVRAILGPTTSPLPSDCTK